MNGNALAFPTHDDQGLTKRELFAAMAMQGLLANSHVTREGGIPKTIADIAVKHAEHLLSRLEKPA